MITTDQFNFILERRMVYGPNSKNAGDTYWKAESFHPSLCAAMQKIVTIGTLAASDVISVEQVIEFMQRQESRIAAVERNTDDQCEAVTSI
jgi:hypothetical protein